MRGKEPQGWRLWFLCSMYSSFDFQAPDSFDRLQARITSTKSRLFGQMLQVACWLRGARHVRFRHSYDFAMSSYILRNRLRIIGG